LALLCRRGLRRAACCAAIGACCAAAGVATGIQFTGVTTATLTHAISRTAELWHRPGEWRRMQQNGMRADFSWQRSGKVYADLYRSLMPEPA